MFSLVLCFVLCFVLCSVLCFVRCFGNAPPGSHRRDVCYSATAALVALIYVVLLTGATHLDQHNVLYGGNAVAQHHHANCGGAGDVVPREGCDADDNNDDDNTGYGHAIAVT